MGLILFLVAWFTLPTVINLLVVLMFYRPSSWQMSGFVISAIAGRRPDGTTRIWGQPDGQTFGSLVQVFATEEDRDTPSLRVHETNHTAWGLCLGLLFWLIYATNFLINLYRYRKHKTVWLPWWFFAYHEIWFEKRARLVAEEYEKGLRPRAWGA